MKRNHLAGAAVATLCVAAAGTVSAYTLLSPQRSWATFPVSVKVTTTGHSNVKSPDPDGGVTAVVNALNSSAGWNSAVPGLVSSTTTGSTPVLGDGQSTVYFKDPYNYCKGSCLAVTLTGYYHNAGGGAYVIDDADVFTNQTKRLNFDSETEKPPGSCSGAYYIEGVMVHEVGHVLGLGHSSVSGATMSAYASTCDSGLKSIESDDATAIDILY